jgi:hypothetical protein
MRRKRKLLDSYVLYPERCAFYVLLPVERNTTASFLNSKSIPHDCYRLHGKFEVAQLTLQDKTVWIINMCAQSYQMEFA